MPWQRQVLDVGLEILPNGRPAYREIIVSVPRQNGKTVKLLALELHRALMWQPQPQRVYYSAQTGQDARKKLLNDQVPVLKASPLYAAVKRVYESAGGEGIVFQNDSRIEVTASGEAAGHGVTADLGIVDEAFADVDDRREQAVKPAMATRPEAQFWICSTAGHEGSAYLKRKVDTGRAAVIDDVDRGIAYFEWSAEPEDAIDDPEVWRRCIPALGYTIDEDVIEHNLRTMRESDFRRAFLNQWTVGEERVIPASLWSEVSRPDVAPGDGLTFGVDVDPTRSHASIVAIDNAHKAELVEYREGTGWLTDRATELAMRWTAQVAIDVRGPAAVIANELELRGVNVVKYSATEMATATSRLYDAIADRQVSIRAHDVMDRAAAGARKRVVVDQWVWARRDAFVDISPLVALTLAYDCAVSIEQRGGTLWVAWG